jgi:hypothetical protein
MKVKRPACPERRELSKIATEAIRGVFIAKENLDAAKKLPPDATTAQDLTALTLALAAARKFESKAVDDLHRHKNTHGC